MRLLENILEELNLTIRQNLDTLTDHITLGTKTQFYRNTKLTTKDGVTFPIVLTGSGKATKISIDNDYPLQIYHRLVKPETEEDPARGYGTKSYRFKIYQMRLFCFGTLKKLNNPNHEYGPDILQIVYNTLPVVLGQGERVQPDQENTDGQEILNSEFNGALTKHLATIHVCFTIDYTIRQRVDCGTPTNDPIVTLNDVDFISANSYYVT